MRVKCDEVRDLLPEYAEPALRPAGPIEAHLASCARCSAQLAQYRELLNSLEDFRESDLEPPDWLLDHTLRAVRIEAARGRLPSLGDLRSAGARVGQALRAPSLGYALASLGGAAVGATAIALVWWRLARRAVTHGAV